MMTENFPSKRFSSHKGSTGPQNPFVEFPKEEIEQTFFKRFEQQVRKYPDRIAIKDSHRTFTYDALNRGANRLAHAILDRCREREKPVALLFESGAEAVIALVGVLKAGQIYVPLDPTHPPSRISHLLEDSQARCIVTNDKSIAAVREDLSKGISVINTDELDREHSDKNPDLSVAPESPAAILYTSGSTGQPKGVIFTHRSMLHSAWLTNNGYHMCPDDRMTMLFSPSVGLSLRSILGCLLNGATLFPYDIRTEGLANLVDWLVCEGITIFHSVVTVFRSLTETLTGSESFPKLRLIVLGGETVHRRDIELYRKHFSDDCLLRLGLGMSEACSVVTRMFIDKSTEIEGDIMPTGYAVEDMEVQLLDDEGDEVGFDRIGEITIKGRYLSPGYWRKPDLTAKAFRPDPKGSDARIYRTGDLGRMSPDGCLFHLGRKDHQIKIRGYRIETAEVERALLNIEGISHAAVTALPDGHGENRLVAYVVCDQTYKPAVLRLRTLLKESLPEYMIPSDFIFMDELPTAMSGKVDFGALPIPDASRPKLDSPLVEPRTPVEKRLADKWAEILGVSPVGLRDTFFDLGGHSLNAVRLFAHIEKQYGVKLPLSTLFQAPTIEKLAALLGKEIEPWNWSSLVPIQRWGVKRPFFCVHSLSGEVVGFADLAHLLGSDQPFYGLQAQGLDGKRKPFTQIEAMASHYIKEMSAVQPEGPYLIGGMCFGGAVAFEMAQQLHAQGQQIRLLVFLDTPCPPFSFQHHIQFHLKRYAWHLRENVFTYLNRPSHRSLTSVSQGFMKRLRAIRHTMRILRVDRANQQAFRNYRPQPYSGRIVHFLVSEPSSKSSADSRMKWKNYAQSGMEVHTVSSDHYSMLREPHVRALAETLNDYLARKQP